MTRDYFLFETSISFGIRTDLVDPDTITKVLNIQPSRLKKKGEIIKSNFSPKNSHYPWNIWAIESKSTIRKDESISHHIEYMKSVLLPAAVTLKKYKADSCYELGFNIIIRTDDAGFCLSLNDKDLSFFYELSNDVQVLITTNVTIKP